MKQSEKKNSTFNNNVIFYSFYTLYKQYDYNDIDTYHRDNIKTQI